MNNPIQCVNAIDDETTPTDFFYVTENCFTSPLHVDRTINSLMVITIFTNKVTKILIPFLLQYCQCSGDCSIDCKCSNLSFQCWYDEEGKLTPDFNFSGE